jgi:predicted Zn-dependent peptidase
MVKHKRRQGPPIYAIEEIAFPAVEQVALSNGIPLFILRHPTYEALKMEVVIAAGRPQEDKPMVSRATARLLREGTRAHSGADLAERLDFFGSSLQTPVQLDTANLVLYSLRKYAEDTIPLLASMVLEPTFPEEELVLFQENNIRELSVELEKGDVIAYRMLTELLFGSGHPYGYNSTPALYRALNREDLTAFHARWYRSDRISLFLSGGVTDSMLRQAESLFGSAPTGMGTRGSLIATPEIPAKDMYIQQPGSLQTAIKVGRRLFNRHHPDFNGMYVLNTILGGYFGSRLSAQIREKLGYTYGIYSSLDAMVHDGFLYIATEVDHQNAAPTLDAIWAECTKLQQEPVAETELSMVRNYLSGLLLYGLDGPLNASDVLKSYVVDGLSLDALEGLIATIRTITPEALQHLAQRYLNPTDFTVVQVGR